ncbi:G1/S-specific cyclin CLN1 [Candida maltosa Xu316]|uniref:G1/S-specific cyclin n=1 Tax=Candida maltosa (strain Xu316) TaxID=1245528 RepID=M3HGF6_CANMX|nr:G1/S-specific cyclin CLN1 [Candida maltosa Xu316]
MSFNQYQQQQQQQSSKSKTKYGPPSHIKRKPYSIMLELLESQANKKLINEYFDDITTTLSDLENKSSVNPAMIDLQPEIQWFMRPFLLDFLIELHSSFKLQPTTLFLCLNIIDRYCAKRIVFKRHYQLVGCTALWIAGKYEDKKSRVPTLKELTIMCRNAYDEEMFVQMEMHILSTLEWSISHPTLEDCLQLAIKMSKITNSQITPFRYHQNSDANKSTSILSAVTAVGRFLCELSLYDKFFLSVPTSLVAITANLLACSMLQIPNASIAFKELLDEVLIKPKKELQQKKNHSVPRHPIMHPNPNTLYFNNNESNYSHQQQSGVRHSSIDDDIDLDYEEEDEEDDYIDDFYEQEITGEDDDETTHLTTFDEEIENKPPKIYGAFLSGLDENALLTIKKIALMMIIQLSKVTEVLSKKYENLGVIQVINNFHSNYKFVIQSIYEKQDVITNNINEIDFKLIQSSEILLQFPKIDDDLTEDELTEEEEEDDDEDDEYHYDDLSFKTTPKSPHPFSSSNVSLVDGQIIAPVTPPSATSQYSVFSNKRSTSTVNSECNTPTHVAISSFAPPQPPPGSVLKTKSKIRKNRNQKRETKFDQFSPIKPSNTTTSSIAGSDSSPLMHQQF